VVLQVFVRLREKMVMQYESTLVDVALEHRGILERLVEAVVSAAERCELELLHRSWRLCVRTREMIVASIVSTLAEIMSEVFDGVD